MAELLIRVVDKVGTDFYKDAKCTKRGDIIVAVPDGWRWGNMERTLPEYRIIQVPGLSVETAEQFCVSETPVDEDNPSKTLLKRLFKFDIDHLTIPPVVKAFFNDDTRQMDILKLAGNVCQLEVRDLDGVTVGIWSFPVDSSLSYIKQNLPQQFKSYIKNHPEEYVVLALPWTGAALVGLKVTKASIVDPNA